MKHTFVPVLAAAFCILITGCSSTRSLSSYIDEAETLHNGIISIDTHNDTPLRMLDSDFDISVRHDPRKDQSKVDFPRMKEGRLDAAFFAAFIAQGPVNEASHLEAAKKVTAIIDSIHSALSRTSALALPALTPRDVYKIKAQNKLAVYIGIENGYAIGTDTTLIRKFFGMGARYITLCHSKSNAICGSSTDPDSAKRTGLTEFGRAAVREMNRTGMLIDVSHISDKAFYDVIRLSKVPVIASHSCARALCDNPRNMSDDMLKALAKNGGVIQMCILSDYVKTMPYSPERDSAMTAYRKKYNNFDSLTTEQRKMARRERAEINERFPLQLADVSDVVDHIDHIVKVAGIDHVGIGTDFDGGGGVNGIFDVSEMKNITAELLRRNYTHEDIRKIWGGNFLRTFQSACDFASSYK